MQSISEQLRLQGCPWPAPPAVTAGLVCSNAHELQLLDPYSKASTPDCITRSLPIPTGTGSTVARNPFAAMPRELRNSQLRSNLQAVAGAFSAGSPPAERRNSMGQLPTQPQQQLQWGPTMMSAGTVNAASGSYLQSPPPPAPAAAYQPAASVACSQPYAPFATVAQGSAPAGMHYQYAVQQQQQQYGCVATSSSMVAGTATGHSARGCYSTPLPVIQLQQQQLAGMAAPGGNYSTYQQPQHEQWIASSVPGSSHNSLQQQQQEQQQFAGQYSAVYSDPLPYLAGASLVAAPAMQQQQQVMYVAGEAMPVCSAAAHRPMPAMAPSADGGCYYSNAPPAVASGQYVPPAPGHMQQQPPPPPPPPRRNAPTAAAVGGAAAGCGQGGNHAGDMGRVQQLLQKQQALKAMESAIQQQLLQLLPDA